MNKNLWDLIEKFLSKVKDDTRYILLFKKEPVFVFNKYDFYNGKSSTVKKIVLVENTIETLQKYEINDEQLFEILKIPIPSRYTKAEIKKIKKVREVFSHNVDSTACFFTKRYKKEYFMNKEIKCSPIEKVSKGSSLQQRKNAMKIVNEKQNDSQLLNIFVDGSYLEHVNMSAYGYVVKDSQGNEINKDFGIVLSSVLGNMKSVGAELSGVLRAIEWSIANGYKEIKIHYDCIQIIDLLKKRETDLTEGELYFTRSFNLYAEKIKIYTSKASSKTSREHLNAHNLSRVPGVLITGV